MKTGKILGMNLVLNDYFLLLLLGYALLGVLPHALIIFSIVLFHELAHVVAAKHYGITAREIELFPFGGVARIDQMLEINPWAEIKIALAGPLSNFFLYAFALLLVPDLRTNPWGQLYLNSNLTLAVFNLLPVLPLDGGRIFRSLAAGRCGFAQANLWAVKWGKFAAVAVGLLGLAGLYLKISDLNALALAAFLYGAALKEEANSVYLFLRYLIRKGEDLRRQHVLPVKHFITTKKARVGEVALKFAPGQYHLIVVTDMRGQELATLTEHQIIAALLEHGKQYPVEKLVS